MTNHYDEMRVTPDPAQAEELRQRLHARLASDSRHERRGGSDADRDLGHLTADEWVIPAHEAFAADASARSNRAHRRRLLTGAAAIIVAVGAAGIAFSIRSSRIEDPLATGAPTTTAPPTPAGPLDREEIRVTPDVIEFGDALLGYDGTRTVAKQNGRLYVLGGRFDGDPSMEDLDMFRPETSVLVAFDDAGGELWRTELDWAPREVVVFDGDPWVRRDQALVRIGATDGRVLDQVTVPPFDLTSAFGSLWFGTSDPEDTSNPADPARLVRLEPDLSTTSVEIPVVLQACGALCPKPPTVGPDALWVPLGQDGVALIDPDTNQVTVIPVDDIGHEVVQVAFDGDVAYVASRDQITSIVDGEPRATLSTGEIGYLGRVDGVVGAEIPGGFVVLRANDPMDVDVRQISERPSGEIDGEAWTAFGRNFNLRRVELLPVSDGDSG